MKCAIPEIAWHNRGPVLSVALQPLHSVSTPQRLASAGADTHVLIWFIQAGEDGNVSIEIVADLARHQRAVNVVRWSPNGEFLASGDDESIIIVWKQKTDVDPPPLEQADDQDREIWLQYKILRGHLEDVYDLCWCPFGNFLISGSVDNTAILWDVHKGKTMGILTDHKGFVQGVSWDPKNQHLATMSTDRVFRLFDITTRKVAGRNSKTTLPVPESHPLHGQIFKLFYDDTLQTYCRRLDYSPEGELIAVPTGLIENEQNGVVNHVNVAYIYKRSQMKSPACVLQCGDSPSLVVRWNPVKYNLRSDGPSPLMNFPTPMRYILAVATRTSVLLYDTQQNTPLAIISNIHYTRLTDLTWSTDGLTLVISSTDGYCSVIKFSPNELGEPLKVDEPKVTKSDVEMTDILNNKENINVFSSTNNDIVQSIATNILEQDKESEVKTTPKSKNNTPNKKRSSKKNTANDEPPENFTVIEEIAMEPWSQDSTVKVDEKQMPEIVHEGMIDDPTEDIKMVYEETEPGNQDESQKKIAAKEVEKSPKITVAPDPPKPLPKAPRRVSFITLSSPKSKKKS